MYMCAKWTLTWTSNENGHKNGQLYAGLDLFFKSRRILVQVNDSVNFFSLDRWTAQCQVRHEILDKMNIVV